MKKYQIAVLDDYQGVALESADWSTRTGTWHRFRELGVSVVFISVDEVPAIAAFAKEQHIDYTMLSDPHGDINLSLGIRDPQYPVGSPACGVPKPTLYILDRRGVIRLRYQEPTYQMRPNLDNVLHDIKVAGL
jgi:peroxiredoxin